MFTNNEQSCDSVQPVRLLPIFRNKITLNTQSGCSTESLITSNQAARCCNLESHNMSKPFADEKFVKEIYKLMVLVPYIFLDFS